MNKYFEQTLKCQQESTSLDEKKLGKCMEKK